MQDAAALDIGQKQGEGTADEGAESVPDSSGAISQPSREASMNGQARPFLQGWSTLPHESQAANTML